MDGSQIAIAGATGFIGRSLIAALGNRQPVIGLSRTAQEPVEAHPNIVWRACSLLDLQSTQQALTGARAAVYLVHSMTPQNLLTRASFEDLDLLCADNFARAAKAVGVQHLVYLSGLIPDEPHLSRHLTSRLEVEEVFATCGIPTTTLRAGMVIGPGGSSFELMSRLVNRLPVVVAPRWTRSKCQAVALSDVTASLKYALRHPEDCPGSWDVGCPEALTYRQMMAQTAKAMGKKRRILNVPFNAPALSLLGVSMLTGTPRQLVVPLVESLQHSMVVKGDLRLQKKAGITPTPFKRALRDALERAPAPRVSKRLRRPPRELGHDILFVERITMSGEDEVPSAAQACEQWLSAFLAPLGRVVIDGPNVYRVFPPAGDVCLLELTLSAKDSSMSRRLFRVTGGLLQSEAEARPGQIEFRAVLDGRFVLIMVREMAPGLKALLVKTPQAALRGSVMRLFRHYRQRRARQVEGARS